MGDSMKNIILAFVSGITNGMFGTGGGVLALPLLERITENKRIAHEGVSLFILPLAILSAALYRKDIGLYTISFLSIGAFIGGVTGALLSSKFKLKYIRLLFGIVIIYIGVKSVF
jgi:uncharacterized membrane protein YfcA